MKRSKKRNVGMLEYWKIKSHTFSIIPTFHHSKRLVAVILLLLLAYSVSAQITSGRIVFERKTNLYKQFKNEDWVKDWVKESDHTKTDEFELFFNDSLSAFKPVESEEKESYSWLTNKNAVYQNLN